MITLADVALPLPTPEVVAAIERDLSFDRLALATGRAWPGFGTVGLATATAYRPWPPQPMRLNRLYWPNGATRWASGLFLAHKDQAVAIHDAVFGQEGDEAVAATLVLSSEDASGNPVETLTCEEMTVFPPIPAYRVIDPNGDGTASDNGMYLVYVADQRYHWWNVPTPDLGINETAGKTWEDVIGDLATALDVTITVDTVETAYLQPSRALNLTNEPIPLVLDSVVLSIGHRLVVNFDGTVKTQAFGTAFDSWTAQQSSEIGLARTVRAGGRRNVDAY